MAQSAETLSGPSTAGFSPLEAATYSRDMLLSLKSIAKRHGQERLAELLDAAAKEAGRLATPSGGKIPSAK